jgi:hypothetical protein
MLCRSEIQDGRQHYFIIVYVKQKFKNSQHDMEIHLS